MKRLISAILIAAVFASALCSCGDGTASDNVKVVDKSFAFTYGLKANKFASIDIKASEVKAENKYIVYKSGNKYGIISPDGKKDTGAVFAYVKSRGQTLFDMDTDSTGGSVYTMMCAKHIPTEKNPNVVGACDTNGKIVVPLEYTYVYPLNHRFVLATKVTGKAKDDDVALLYYDGKEFKNYGVSDGIRYKGAWVVYDITTGKKVKGLYGTSDSSNVKAYGNYLTNRVDWENVTYDCDGNIMNSDFVVLNNGDYFITDYDNITVYNKNGEKLFAKSSSEISSIKKAYDGYYQAVNYGEDKDTNFILDSSGNKVSPEYKENIELSRMGHFFMNDKFYSPQGKKLLNYGSAANMDDIFKETFSVYDRDKYTLFDMNDRVMFETHSKNIYNSFFCISKVENYKKRYYRYADKKFAVKGHTFDKWLVTSGDDSGTMIDLRSGRDLFGKSYAKYQSIDTIDGKMIVLTFDNYLLGKGRFDMYEITLDK